MRPQGIEWEQEWLQRFERWAEAFPAVREDWDADRTGKPRPGWIEALPEFPAGEAVASRDAGKTVMQALKPFTPTMVGGAADLVESTKTEFEGAGLFSRQHAGRNIPFGIREHAMGSIVNGIGLTDGMLKPYGSTFLIFSDYMRPAVRLSALGHMQSLWVWTHDSVGVGEDGPTHQPVEHHMALRAIPNLWYVRPGDANETAMAWRIALEREGGPVALALSRQKLETLDRTEVAPAEGALRGAYTLWQSGDGTPDLLLLATGSELGVAYEAAQAIDANVRVVSMPCWELFAEQPQDYRDEVLPPDVGARLSVEAGIPHGWERWVGEAGGVGRDRPLRRVGTRRRGAGEPRLHARERGDARGCAARAGRGMKVAVAFDHRGVKLRERILEELDALGHETVDLGTDTDAKRIDYPDKARELGDAILGGDAERGVLVCGSGVGASVAACKIAGIRAAICHDVYSAHQGVEHDDMNVLCLGSEVIGAELAVDLVRAFLGARFDGGERYVERLRKVEAMEKEMKDGHVTTA